MHPHILRLFFLVPLTALAWAQSAPADPPPAVSGGSLFLGTQGFSNNGWQGRVGEFDTNKDGLRPVTSFSYWYSRGPRFLDFYGENRGDSRDQVYSLQGTLGRRLQFRSALDRFLHRLDHDPLSNLDAAKGSVVVRYDNLNPNRAYTTGRSELKTEIRGVINQWLSWRASHRFLQTHGDIQTRAISKCANCHVTGRATRVDQRLQDLSAGLSLRLGKKAVLHYDFTSRQFKEHGERPAQQYDVAQHPTSLSRVFFNRVQFDGTTNGLMPYAYVPGYRKDSHELQFAAELPADARLTARMMKTRTTNTHTRLDMDVLTWGARYVLPLGARTSLKAQLRHADLHSDDVFIQLEEPANPAGVPQPGQTYSQAYPAFGSADWTRHSSINRRDFQAVGELSHRLARLTTLRAGYQFRTIRRDDFEVERTDRNRLFAQFQTRSHNTWNSRVRYTFETTDQPFLHAKAALSPALQLTPSAGNPPSPLNGLQYFSLYAARQANLTNQPTRSQLFEPSFTWTPSPRAALTLHYRTRQEKNDQLNYSTWNHTSHLPGAELWVSPLERLNFTLSYQAQWDKTDTLFVIPVFDG